jgi:neural Wiskott-Aldrich syndrome protein
VAETSGFMTELPQSAYLSLSIRRAISAAQQRSHRYVTLEHLLLSLLDDPDALALLEGVRADIAAVKVSAADTVNRNLATLYTPGQFDLRASYKVERVLQTASDDADRLNCQEVDAAFVLAAISRESDNPAADILKRNSFTYSAAMTWLYSNRGKSTGGRPAPKLAAAPTTPPSASPAPQEAAPAQPAPLPARESPGLTERLAAGEDQDSELELEEVSEVESKPDAKPSRESPQAPVPAAATRTAPSSPSAKPQMVPPFDDDDDDFYQDEKYSTASPQQPYAQPRSREASEGGSGYAPAPAPPPIPRRAELQVPSPARLDQMRVRPGASRPQAPLTAPALAPPPSPAPAPAPQPSAKQAKKRPLPAPAPAAAKGAAKSAAPDRAKGRQKRRPGPYDALLGRLIENIPRRMRAAVPERIEVRISREDSVALGRGMEGRAEPVRHDIMITQAMSVMLRSPDGGFNIEPLSPETQWIFERPEAADGETYGRWRWVVTPNETGQRRLQVIIAARSIDKNGLVGDTALPDQVITVRVRMNVLRSLGRGIQWLAAMILGGVLTEIALIGMRILEK